MHSVQYFATPVMNHKQNCDTYVTFSALRDKWMIKIYFQDGNPFGPFWNYVGVDFDTSVLFGGISFSAYHQPQWMKK